MKLCTYVFCGAERPGVLSPDGRWVIPISDLGFSARDLNEVITTFGRDELEQLSGRAAAAKNGIPLSSVRLEAPIPHPLQDVIGLGLNYYDHNDETARYNFQNAPERSYPIYFARHTDRAVAPFGEIQSHNDFISTLDYEGELGVIIGRDAYHVPKSEVWQYIFGYTIINDVTARELVRHKQNFFMKSLCGTMPMGPWIVTADEFAYPPVLRIRTWVNGELRQDGDTGGMIFDIDEIVSCLTKGVLLKAGSIIATGTPSGTGMGFNPSRYLGPGDVVRCEIEGIGHIENTVI